MSRKIAYCAVLLALAMIFSYVEVLIPVSIGIPGVKLGLANLVTVTGLALLAPPAVFLILLGRILLVSLLFGTGLSAAYSLAGGVLSFLVMYLMYRFGKKSFSLVGVSVAGGIAHNIGQLAVAALVLENDAIFMYLPVLLAVGTITGFLIGFAAEKILPVVQKAFGTAKNDHRGNAG